MSTSSPTVDVVIPHSHMMADLLGMRDEHLRRIEDAFPSTRISVRGNVVSLAGADSAQAGRLFEELVMLLQKGESFDSLVNDGSIDMVRNIQRPSDVL
ncbi:MAG: phosphate starvation-inducible protein PhoH, partial [Actinobacteria bacterium]|nr:phosphate starvation-inducible protein PhoH [Actinomycetota bacterium]